MRRPSATTSNGPSRRTSTDIQASPLPAAGRQTRSGLRIQETLQSASGAAAHAPDTSSRRGDAEIGSLAARGSSVLTDRPSRRGRGRYRRLAFREPSYAITKEIHHVDSDSGADLR